VATPAEAASRVHAIPLELQINGTVHRLQIDPRVTLLDLLQERLGLTGTKKGCDHGQCGAQCGYCTPGQICSAVAMLSEVRRGGASFVTRDLRSLGPVALTDEEIRERMSGNICRCRAYPGIVAAVKAPGNSRSL